MSNLNMINLDNVAEIVDVAAKTASSIPQLSKTGYDLTLDLAYEVQRRSVKRRYDRGEKAVGIKMGFTSRAKIIQMGLDGMVWGRLTNKMLVEDGGEIDLKDFVHPRVEPEIAFLLKKPIEGIVSPAEAMLSVEAIAPALEIIDSRYENFKFNLPDVVADNTSTSAYVGAAKLVAEDGGRLEAGWTIMAGGATAAEALNPDIHVRLEVQNMGSVGFSVI